MSLKHINNRLSSAIILIIFVTALLFFVDAGSALGYTIDTISVNSFYLEDMATAKIIAKKNLRNVYPAASTLKLVTAMIVKKRLKQDTVVRVTRRASKIEPTKAYLRWGEKYYAKDLLRALLIKSANDAAVSLAVAVSGSEKKFTLLMNRWCRVNNIRNTHIADSSGLSDKSVSTAEDLLKIFKIFSSDKENLNILKKRKLVIKSLRGRRIVLRNSNNLFLYRNELGGSLIGKTGFTRRAKYCFAGIVYFRRHSYYIVIMGADMAWHGISILMNYANDIYTMNR